MRISVVGNSGSGKTTAAREIATALNLPHLELDNLRHQENWRELPDPEFLAAVQDFIRTHEHWVIDGNYRIVQSDIWSQASEIVWLDIPKFLNMKNIITRTFKRVLLRTPLWNGNRESIRNLTSRDPYKSMIAWTWHRHAYIRDRYVQEMKNPLWAHVRFLRFQNSEEFHHWLAQCLDHRDSPRSSQATKTRRSSRRP